MRHGKHVAVLTLLLLIIGAASLMAQAPAPPTGLGIGTTPKFQLTVATAGNGTGTVTGTGIACGSDCTQSFNAGAAVTLTATPTGGATFTGWSGSCAGTGSCILSMTSAQSVVATFTVPASGTVLAQAASSLGVGQWVRIDTLMNGWNAGQITQNPGGDICTIFQYSGKAVWNPIANRFQAAAGTHGDPTGGCPGPNYGAIFYQDSTNTWGNLPALPFASEPVHIFDGNAMGTDGAHYVTLYNDPNVRKLANGAGSWQVFPVGSGNNQVSMSNVFFPNYPGGAKVIHIDPEWGIWAVDPTTGASTCIANTNPSPSLAPCAPPKPQLVGFGDRGPGSIYSPACQCVLIGAATAFYKLDSSGNFTSMNKSGGPAGFGTGGAHDSANGQYITEPVTGKILHISNTANGGDGALRFFDPTAGATGTWTVLMTAAQMPAAIEAPGVDGGATGMACAGVPLYGVSMCIKTNGQTWNGASVWLYKHSASGPVNPTLTVAKAGTGAGTVTGTGISCGADCTESVVSGTPITLTASATNGSSFTGWSGGGCSGSGLTCNVTVSSNVTVTATFADTQAPTISGFTATPFSSSQIDLSGTDADNIAVVDRTFEFCQGAGCSNFVSLPGQPVTTSTFRAQGLTASTSYSFRYRARDAASLQSGFSSTASATTLSGGGGGSADADFLARCNAAIATGGRCFSFDTTADIQRPTFGGTSAWGANFGAFSAAPTPDIDTTTKVSGAGSLRFTTPPGTGAAGGGAWFTNFSNPAATFQLAEGEEVWVQYRWMPDTNTLNPGNNPSSSTSGWGFKLGMVGTGDTAACSGSISNANCPGSCSDMETVIQPNFFTSPNAAPLFAYATCGAPIGQGSLAGPSGGINLHPNSTGSPTRSCLYPGPWGEPNCFNFVANQWHTVKYYIKIGNWNQWNSTIKIYAGKEGQPLQLVIHCGPGAPCTANPGGGVPGGTTVNGWYLYNSNPALYKMGKVWLLPYVTNATGPVATNVTRYDELIISKGDIADPGASPPATPTLTVSKTGTGTGTVSSAPAGIDCGATCAASFTSGTPVTLTAMQAGGSTFTGWSGGGCSGTGTCVVPMTSNTTVNAVFDTTAQQFGLEFDGTGSVRRMLYWSDPFPIYPATYLFRVLPRKKTCPAAPTAYFTTFFWGNNGPFAWQSGQANTYYGMHPYPAIGSPPSNCNAGAWEISVNSADPNTGVEVQWDRWHTQAIRVRRVNATTTEHEFYYDWNVLAPPSSCTPGICISQTVSSATWATTNPTNPAVVIGQAPDLCGPPPCTSGQSWGGYPGWEEFKGVIRGIQMYTQYLSLTDIQAELTTPKSSTVGQASIWYLNLDPRPTDVTDKKATAGTPHPGTWACPGIQTTCSSVTEWVGP